MCHMSHGRWDEKKEGNMFEILDVVICLAIIYMVLSMVHKYLMSLIKRIFKMKGSEMV